MKLNKNGKTESEFLSEYNPGDYEKPSVTVDMLLFTIDELSKCLKVLLIKRGDHPFIDDWALPGGFVNIDEGIEAAAYRELKEETNIIENVYLEQLYTFGDVVNRDPRMRVITCAYMSLTPPSNIKKSIAGDDAKEAAWFNIERIVEKTDSGRHSRLKLYCAEKDVCIEYLIDEKACGISSEKSFRHVLGSDKLAFDHYESIFMAIERLQNKVEYTHIAFSLLPKEFTLLELQSVYESILSIELEKSNFRKKIKHMLIETEKDNRGSVSHRPAKYYRFNPFY